MLRRNLLVAVLATGIVLSDLCAAADGELRVGATAGPHAAIVSKAAEVAAQKGLKVKVYEFTDYITPNTALNEGQLDVVVYQHEPFLTNFNQQRGTNLKKIADAVVQPMGLYSDKIHNLKDIPVGARISIPNDPTNSGRALLLLQNAGLITLEGGSNQPLITDVKDNPKKLKIVELEAAQLPRSLSDVEVAAVPMNYVISSGLSPEKQGFYFESRQAPFALMIIASREDNKDDPKVKQFVESYRSQPVKEFIDKEFKGSVKAAW